MKSGNIRIIFKNSFGLGNRMFSLIPIICTPTSFKVNRHKKLQRQTIWILYFCFVIAFTCNQINQHLRNSVATNLVFVVFHISLLNIEIGASVCLLPFHFRTLQLCQLLNHIIKNPSPKTKFRSYLLVSITVVCCAGLMIMFCVTLPLIYFSFSELIHLESISLKNSFVATVTMKYIYLLVHTFLYVPFGKVCATMVAIAFVTVDEIQTCLKSIQRKFFRFSLGRGTRSGQAFGHRYRQIQIIMVSANQFLQWEIL